MKNTKKLLAVATLGAIVLGATATYAANSETFTQLGDEQKQEIRTLIQKKKSGEALSEAEQNILTSVKEDFGKGLFGKKQGKHHMGERFIDELTDEEKTQLESMNDEQKQAFFETKRAEQKAKREARENVIDKLLAGETLTAEEENLRAEIIKERAERKVKMQEMEQKREEMKTIMEKKKAGEELSEEEQTVLDEMKQMRHDGKRGNRGAMRR